MEDPSWQRNCDLLAKSLQSLDRKATAIRRSTNKVVALKDINKEREKVKQITGEVNKTDVHSIQKGLKLIEQYTQLNTSLRAEGVKLMNEANTALKAYQAACDAFYKRCISVEETSRSQMRPTATFRDESDGESESRALIGRDGAPATQSSMFERDLYDEIMAERQRETQEIAENVRDIHEIFEHMNEMIGEQGVQLDVVDNNLSTAERATANATEHLRRAQQYQQTSSRNKLLFVFVIVVACVVMIAVVLS